MKYFTSLIIVLAFSCTNEQVTISNCYNESDPPRSVQKVTIEQGLWGDVWFWSGNFMPVGRGEICQVKRKIYIYDVTTFNDVVQIDYTSFYSEINTNLITTAESNSDGFFQVELKPGDYSIFIQEDGNYYANSFSSYSISSVQIESEKVSEIRFDITYKAVF